MSGTKKMTSRRCWDASLQEVSCDAARALPTVVRIGKEDDATWVVRSRFHGEEILFAEGLEFGEAADMVMAVFDGLLEERSLKDVRLVPA
ncbi:MAG: hypothetical protein ACYC6T_08065 [Thermoleophilia bacterium]